MCHGADEPRRRVGEPERPFVGRDGAETDAGGLLGGVPPRHTLATFRPNLSTSLPRTLPADRLESRAVMVTTAAALLAPSRRASLLDELERGAFLGQKLLGLAAVIVAGAALYGAVLGSWQGDVLILWTAIKLPLVLLITASLTLLLNWMLALLLGVRLELMQVAVLSFLALAIAALVLASLAPVAWLFTVSAPPPSEGARTAHNLLYLFHTLLVAGAGTTGMMALWRALHRLAGQRARQIYVAWLLAFAFVGGEVAWALRPFVGSIYYEVAFVREDALEGNVYEFILFEIAPYLLSAE